MREQKEKGLIRHWGFSFHADPELLEELLDRYPDAEFVQLQINYADWDNPGVASRRNWEICQAHGKPVVIMEPVKGGVLADPIPGVKQALDAGGKGWSYAGWALRYAASINGLITVLSGMSNEAQMEDNLRTMRNFTPLNEEEREVIRKAQEALNADKSIACTACHYCTAGCPMNIAIPDYFALYNKVKQLNRFDGRMKREFNKIAEEHGKPSDCIQCGTCESMCPQHINIRQFLEDIADELESKL